MHLKRKIFQAPLLFAIAILCGHSVQAVTRTWTNTSGGFTMDTAGNWSGSAIPLTGDEALIDNTTSNTALTLSTAQNFGDLVINSSSLSTISLTGATSRILTLTGGGGSTAAVAAGGATGDLLLLGTNVTGTVTIGGGSGTGKLNLTIGADGNFNVVNSSATLVVSGILAGTQNLTKTGAGALTLSGVNTFGAGKTFELSAGTVNINSTTAIGSATTTFKIDGGTTIDNTSGAAITTVNANPITINGNFGYSTATGSGTNNLSFKAAGAVSMGVDSTITLNGAGSLTFLGILTNTADSVRTLTVNNGATSTTFGSLTLGGYNLTGAGSTAARNDIINGSGNVTISGVVADGTSAGSGLNYTGSGTLTLGGANTFTGGLGINGGTVVATAAGGLGTSSNTATFGGGNLELRAATTTYTAKVDLSGTDETITINPASVGNGVTHTLSGTTTFGTHTTTISAGLLTNANTAFGLTLSGSMILNGSPTFVVNTNGTAVGTLTLPALNDGGNTRTITLLGGGNLTLNTAAASFINSSSVAVKSGTLVLGAAAALGTGTSAINLGDATTGQNAGVTYTTTAAYTANPIFVQSGSGTRTITFSSGAGSTNNAVSISGPISLANDVAFVNLAGSTNATPTISGNITGAGNVTTNGNNASGKSFTISGSLNYTGNLTNSGSGIGTVISGVISNTVSSITQNSTNASLTISGANTAAGGFGGAGSTGTVNVTAGTLKMGSTGALGAVNLVTISNSGTFDINNKGVTIAGLADGSGGTGETVTNNAASAALILGGTGNYTYAGLITGANMGITASLNGGTQTLSGNSNNYAGATLVTAGTLILSGSNGLVTGTTGVSGGVLEYSGSNSINGSARNVAVSSGGVVKFGSSFGSIQNALTTRIVNTSAGVVALSTNDSENLDFSSAGANLTAGYLGAIGNVTYSGTLTPNDNGVYRLGGGGGTLTMANILTGTSALTVGGGGTPGTVILTGTQTYTGLTTVTSGTLKLAASSNLVSGSNLTTAAAGVVDFNGNTQTLGVVTNAGNITNSNTNSITLTLAAGSGATGSYTGKMNLIVNTGSAGGGVWSGPILTTGDLTINANGGNPATLSGTIGNTGNITLNENGGGAITLSGFITGNQIITNSGTFGTTAVISANIGSGTGSVVQSSALSPLTLSGSNSFTGGVNLQAGKLILGNARALGTGTFGIAAGTSLDSNVANLVITGNNAQNWNGNFTFVGTQNLDLGAGAVTLGGPVTVTTTANTLTVDGAITGASTLTKAGAGTLALTGSSGASFTGNTVVNAGILNFSNHSLGDGAATITLGGGTLQYAAGNTQDVGSRLRTSGVNALKIDVNNNPVVFASPLTDASLTQGLSLTSSAAGGSLTLNGSNTYTGLTTVGTGATLKLGTSSTIASGNALTTVGTGIFDINNNVQTLGTVTNAGTITNSGSATPTLTIGAQSTGAGNFTGNMNVIWNQGVSSTSLSGTWANIGNITFNTTDTFTQNVTGFVNNTGAIVTGTSVGGTGTTTISGSIGALVQSVTANGARLILSGSNTNFGGPVNLNSGILQLDKATALGGNGSTSGTGGALSIAAGTTLDTSIANMVISTVNAENWNGSFSFLGSQNLDLGAGAITLAAPLTLTTTAKMLTVNGLISGGNGVFDITKAGSGTFAYTHNIALSGTQVANVTAGTELLSGVLSGSGAGLTLAGGGTLNLTGSNTYSGSTLVKAGTLSLTGSTGGAASSNITANIGTAVNFDSSTAGVAGTTRANSLTLIGGKLNVTGNANGAGNVNSVDTINGALTVDSVQTTATGAVDDVSIVTVTGGTNSNWQLVSGSLARANSGVVLFRGTNLGAAPIGSGSANSANIVFTAAPTLVGGSGTAGTQNIGIIPWALGDTNAAGGGSSFVTYDANGIRPLTAAEYDNSITGGTISDHNISLLLSATTTTTVNGDTTVNSLFLTTSGTGASGILTGTGKLTVTSGAVFGNYGTTGLTISKQIDFGNVQGVIGSSNGAAGGLGSGLVFSGGISGSAGVVVYNSANIPASADTGVVFDTSTYTGDTIVLGTLNVVSITALPNGSRTGDIYVYGRLTLQVGGGQFKINGLNGTGEVNKPHSTASNLQIGDNNASGTFSGNFVAAGGLSITKIGTGTQILSGTSSTYASTTSVRDGILSVTTLNSTGSNAVGSSSLGAPTTTANGTIALGNTTTTGQLTVVGTGETTDRVINLAGTTGGAKLDQSGTGLLKFTSALTATGAGNKTLTLQGSTAGTGEIAGAIVNSSGTNKTSVTKDGTGTWNLSGTSTYTGATTVLNGTLKINGVLSGTTPVTVGNASTASLTPTLGGGIGNANGGSLGLPGNTPTLQVYNSSATTGNIAGAVTISGTSASGSAGHLAPGNSVGTITMGALTLSGGSILDYEFNGSANDFTVVTGALTLNSGTAGINLYQEGTTTQFTTAGTYDLFQYGSLVGSVSNLSVLNPSGTNSYTFGTTTSGTNNYVTLTIAPAGITSTNYTLAVSAGTSKMLTGGSTAITTTITNTGTTGQDGLSYTGLGSTVTGGPGSVTGGTTSGSLAIQTSGSNAGNQKYVSSGSSGVVTVTAGVSSANNSTLGGAATLTGSAGTVSVSVYDPASLSFSGTGNGQTWRVSNAAATAGGLRSDAIITSSTLVASQTQAGWSTALSGTIASSGSAVAASFTPTGKLNGSYQGKLVVSAQNDQTISGASANDVLNSATTSLTATVTGNTSTSRTDVSSADVLSGQAYGTTAASSGTSAHDGTSSGYGLAISGTVAGAHTNTGNAGIPTTATLINGVASARNTVKMSFDTTAANGVTNANRTSDILTLAGLNGTNPANGQVVITDIYVLQLTYDTTATGVEYIGWNNGNQFVNAIAGNDTGGVNGNAPTPFGSGALNESYADYLASSPGSLSQQLGAYGYYNGVAWAVMDHSGISDGINGFQTGTKEFAVIPEPGTWGMILSGFGMLIGIQKLRRRRVGT